MKITFPKELTPLEVKAYLYEAFNLCGCEEFEEILAEIVKFLEWAGGEKIVYYDELFKNIGVYYIVANIFDNLGLIEHGTSIRFPWLLPDGKKLLDFLKETPAAIIKGATGEASNGLYYHDS